MKKEPLQFLHPFTCTSLRKIISKMKKSCRQLKLNSLSPHTLTPITHFVSPLLQSSNTPFLKLLSHRFLIHWTSKGNCLYLVSSFHIFLILPGKRFYWSMNVMTFPRWWQLQNFYHEQGLVWDKTEDRWGTGDVTYDVPQNMGVSESTCAYVSKVQ